MPIAFGHSCNSSNPCGIIDLREEALRKAGLRQTDDECSQRSAESGISYVAIGWGKRPDGKRHTQVVRSMSGTQ